MQPEPVGPAQGLFFGTAQSRPELAASWPGLARPRACSAGLKNTVPVDCCERKILFWYDVNSDFVRARTSQPNELGDGTSWRHVCTCCHGGHITVKGISQPQWSVPQADGRHLASGGPRYAKGYSMLHTYSLNMYYAMCTTLSL